MNKKLFQKYFDYSNPGSFSGVSGFYKNNPEFSKEEIIENLAGNKSYTYHKKTTENFKRLKFKAEHVDHIWQVDLIDFRNLKNKKFKQWVGYIYVCVDVLSRYAWVEPIETKTSECCKKALDQIIKKSNRKPEMIYSDHGNEFMGEYKKYLKKMEITQYFSNSKFKAGIAERFIRTIKEKIYRVLTYRKQKKYIDILQDLTKSYNNSFHRSIGMSPSEVNRKNQQTVYDYQYSDDESDIVFKFEIGEYVRIVLEKNIFEKGYTQKWSTEVLIIDKKFASNPPTYTVRQIDESDINIKKYYYAEELQRVKPEEFPYDAYQVLEQEGTKLLVKKLNDADQEETWIEKKSYNLRERKAK